MSVRSISALALLAVLAGCGQRQAAAESKARPQTQAVRADRATTAGPRCGPGERPVYLCPFKQKTLSVCATDRTVTYRYGPAGRTDLTITADGANGRGHLGTVRGPGRGGSQTSLRFSNGGYEYIVYSAIGGTETAVPGRQWSGLVVMKGADEVSSAECPAHGPGQRFTLDTAPTFLPREDNPDYEAFF